MTPWRPTLALVGLLPWARAMIEAKLPASLKSAIDLAFVALCHHAPGRTLVFGREAMCVCSRCAGVYAGLFLAAAWPWALAATSHRRVLSVGVGLMIADIVSQDLGLHAPWHVVRLTTGAIVGYAAAAWMLSEIERSGLRAGHQVDGCQAVSR